MRIEIICTGDEVLTGKIVNTNFSYMTQKLEDAGLSVFWGTTVGDDRESLLRAFQLAGERAGQVLGAALAGRDGLALDACWIGTAEVAAGELGRFDGIWLLPGSRYESMTGAMAAADIVRWVDARI